jgi:hypothetical protein
MTKPDLTLVDISHIDMSKFIIKDQYFGYIYPFLTEQTILESLLTEIVYYKLNDCFFNLFVEAWNSRFWVERGYDGATFLKNKKHTAVGNFLHDYGYRMGMGGYGIDKIYKYILTVTGYNNIDPMVRYFGVRSAWTFFFKWKHIHNNNVFPITENMEICLEYSENYLKNK